MIVIIFVTQNNFLNGPGISDRLLGFYPELKCGLCEHHQKCQNNHQHYCGHLRKEEEEEVEKREREIAVN